MAVVLVILLLLRRYLEQPLDELTLGLATIARGKYDHRLSRQRQEDMQVMVDAVNTMAEAIAWGPPAEPLPDPTGMITERVIQEGEILRSPAVRPPLFVRGGDAIQAVLREPGVVMRLKAEALSSAREGERVLLRLASGLRTEGTAIAPGLVELTSGGAR